MKKVFLTLALIVSGICAVNAQGEDKAIGLRLGYGGEISYQQSLGSANRIELDLGINNYGFGLSGIYQWVWDLSALSDGFNWYAGVGANLGSFDYDTTNNTNGKLNIGALGQIGIEYNFDIPLQLSLDYRPGIYFLDGVHSSYDGICLSARYKF